MEQERPSTPEKQLLKLIEDPKTKEFSSKGIKYRGRSLFSFAAFRGRFSFFKEKVNTGLTLRSSSFDIKVINNVLQFSIFVLVLYLGGSSIFSISNLKKMPELSIDKAARTGLDSQKIASLLNKSSYYIEKARSRDIFKFGNFFKEAVKQEVVETPPPEEEVILPSKAEIVSEKLSLVGIAWSDDPDAMIEDVNTQKIYFLKRGDSIEGIKVQTILRDRVILSYEGEEVELR